MSNARTVPDSDCNPFSPYSSRPPNSFDSGATRIQFGSNSPHYTSISNVREKTCGEWSSLPATTTTISATDTLTLELGSLSSIVDDVGYVARVSAAIERIATTQDKVGVLQVLRICARTLGAQNAAFINFVRDDTDIASCRFVLACEPGWCRRYLESGCIQHDPWLAYAANHAEPVIASTLRVFDAEAKRVTDLAARHGFASAVLVPVHSGTGHSRISLLSLGSSTPGYFEAGGIARFRLGARLLAAELHDWWMTRARRELLLKARITDTDLELLRHEHLGHGSKRIAAALHVSASSINSRFQRMNAKLGVPNRRVAARLAAECGLLD